MFKGPKEREQAAIRKVKNSFRGLVIVLVSIVVLIILGAYSFANADVTTSLPEYEEGEPVDWAGGNTCGWALYTSDDSYTQNLFEGVSGIIGSSGSDLYDETGGLFPDTPASYRLMCLQDGNCTGDYAACDVINSGIPVPWEARFDVIEAATSSPATSTIIAILSTTTITYSPGQTLFNGMALFFIPFFGLIFYFKNRI